MNKTSRGLYYTAPSQEIFEEVKNAAILIWEQHKYNPVYMQAKIDKVEGLKNVRDNFMYIVGMFDYLNMLKLEALLSSDAKHAIYERMN